MIVWLASYPRSGNTLLRLMLHQVFGCTTYSKHYSPRRSHQKHAVVAQRIGSAPLPHPWAAAGETMSRDPNQVYIVKTHDPPDDDQPALYIVRNGLAAVRSYKHFLYDFNRLDYSLEQVILGEPLFGSWGKHLDAWNPLERAHTLVLKYEDLVERADEQLGRIAEFLGMKQKAAWINNFAELHEAHPTLFRQGPGVTPTHGFDDRQLQLFSALHGDWMASFNYSQPTFTTHRELRALVAEYTSQLGSTMFSPDRSSSAASLLKSN